MTFRAFWALYPRHVGKKDAEKAWNKLKPDAATWEAMVTALAWQMNQPSWLKDGGAYVPYPATWLRGERWTDEPPASMVPRFTRSLRDWRDECAVMHGSRCSNVFFHEALKGETT